MLPLLEAILRASPKTRTFQIIDNDPLDAGNFLFKIRCELISGQVLQVRLRAIGGSLRYSYQSSGGSFRLHWWLAEYVAGELVLEKREVSDARWLTPDEICVLEETFEGDREFFEKALPSLTA